MHASIKTVAFCSIDTILVEVHVHAANGLLAMAIVGFVDKAVAESRERIRAALAPTGLALPPKRIAINLAPADVVKEGTHYDLPIALGLLVAIGTVLADAAWASDLGIVAAPGPMIERFDMIIEVLEVSGSLLLHKAPGEPTVFVARRVAGSAGCCLGTGLGGACGYESDISGDGRALLEKSIETQSLLARWFHRILRVA